ncbi:MAG: hypothetical protein ACR2OM_05080 [Aestuariivirgaceae bacterium]
MRPIAVIAMLMVVLAGGCTKTNNVNVVSSPYSSGKTHTEPVVFNGKPYNVGFTYRATQDAYDVTVAGKGGRALGGGDGDRKIVEQIGSSTVRHFACAGSKKGRIVPGSARPAGDKWQMQAKCA